MFPTKKVQSMVGSKIQVEMKGSPRYVLEGMLSSVDEYLNLHLLETVELVGGEKTRSLGSVILRGNNIILISRLSNLSRRGYPCRQRRRWSI
jgi:small nuclear ribonucleoprotein (snRNP)-like protein